MGNAFSAIACVLFLVLLVWWAILHITGASSNAQQVWAASYQVMALYGAIIGIIVSQRWGGMKSVIGRSILAFSVGLLLQVWGQSTYSFYIYFLDQAVPYPSIGDIGYFGSIFAYLYGAMLLAKASGVKISLRSYDRLAIAALLPLALLWVSYLVFLRSYDFDWSVPLKVALDLGYPLGQAAYVSAAAVAFILSRTILGGIMRVPIICFIVALVFQYFADFTFLFQANQGSWYAGGWNDFLYATSYTLMTYALIYIGTIYRDIQSTFPGSIVGGVLHSTASIFSTMAASIIHKQALVIGPLAWSEARKVQGIQIDMTKDEVAISDDGKNAIDRLVAQYERLFGAASRQVCREAVASITAGLPRTDIPASLLS